MNLEDGSRIGIIGAGPAGSFTAWFLLDLADRLGLDLRLDIFDSKDFSTTGPGGCNNCGGIISESLVQMLAAEGLVLPSEVVQRGIDCYVLHTEYGSVRLPTPLQEMRIAAVHRGAGPRGSEGSPWESFDAHLLDRAREKGARFIQGRVEEITWDEGRPHLRMKRGRGSTYDLVVGAVGVNAASLGLFEDLGLSYRPPRITKTSICEYHLGQEAVTERLGNAMHVFLLDVPRLEFAAVIPKGEYATACLLGERIDRDLTDRFFAAPQVRDCFPPEIDLKDRACRCGPRLQLSGATHPYGDRVVMVGDTGVSRLYKDGIGAAYRSAKAAALAAVFEGISAEALQRGYMPTCRNIATDNTFGRLIFGGSALFRRFPFLQRAMLRMVEAEQDLTGKGRHMSRILWDTFTGSAPYREILLRGANPGFVLRFAAHAAAAMNPFPSRNGRRGQG